MLVYYNSSSNYCSSTAVETSRCRDRDHVPAAFCNAGFACMHNTRLKPASHFQRSEWKSWCAAGGKPVLLARLTHLKSAFDEPLATPQTLTYYVSSCE